MRKRKPNNRKLSVYLMKEEFQKFESIVKERPDEYDVKHGARIMGKLYIKAMRGHCPAWFSLFNGSVQEGLRGKLDNRIVSAAFLLKRKGRVFAVTFGYGRSLLKQGTWEERFGLMVVLNSIDREKIRIIERKNLDTMLTQTRTQTSRKCAIEEFNLDVQQILLKAVLGEPREKTFASSISGADALSITSQVTLDTIETKCDEMLKAFTRRDYKKVFPWVNNLSEVTNKQKVEELNQELIRRVKVGEENRLFLAVPDMLEWTGIEGFKFRESDEEIHTDLFLHDFLNTVRSRENLDCQYLRQRRVFQVHTVTGVAEPRWSVYHCFNCEVTGNGRMYILTEGRWYEVNASFVAQINKRIKQLEKDNIHLVAGKDEKEAEYCQRLHNSNKSHYALMDGKMIRHGGGHSQMEFCDLFTKDNKLIHLKRYAGSSVLSHLFMQGANSAKAFISDVDFRKKVNILLPTSHRIDPAQTPISKDYQVVFGIISKSAPDVPENIPFFSKITLTRVAEELTRIMGYKMSVAGIRIGD